MRCALPLLIIVLIVRKVAGLSVRTFRILAYSRSRLSRHYGPYSQVWIIFVFFDILLRPRD